MNEKSKKKYLKNLALFLAIALMISNSGMLAMASSDDSSQAVESTVSNESSETTDGASNEGTDKTEEKVVINLSVDETYQLPTNGENYENKSEDILSINEETKIVTAKKTGVGKIVIDEEEYTFVVRYQFELTEDQVIMGKINTHQLSIKDLLDAYKDKITWESSDTSVITINQDGLIEPIKEGTSKVKVTCDKGEEYEYSVEIPVNVTNNEYFYFSKDINEIDFKSLKEIEFSANIDVNKITFVSESPEIIGTNNRIVTSIAPGEAKINAVYKDKNNVEKIVGSCTVKTIGDISINDSKIDTEKNPCFKSNDFIMYSVDYNDELNFSADITPKSFSEEDYKKYVTWKSTDENNVTVDQNGNVKIIGFGGADVVVTLFEGTVSEVSKEISVGLGFEAEIIPSFDSMQIGETVALSLSTTSNYLRDHQYTWVSSNPEVATVDADGNVTAVGVGTTSVYPVSEAFTKAREELSTYNDEYIEVDSSLSSKIEVEGTTITKNNFSMYIGKTRDLGDNSLLDNAIELFERQNNVVISKSQKTNNSETESVSSDPVSSEPVSSEPVSSESTSSEPTSSEPTSSEPDSGENEQTLVLDWDISNNEAIYIEKSIATALDYGVVNVSPFVEIDGQRVFLTNEDGSKLTFTISIINKFNMEVEKNMKVGETSKIICSGLPLDTIISSENAKWVSDDETVATVDADGNVTTVGPGSCFITFTSKELDRENQLVNNDDTPVEYICQVYSTYSFDMETADQEMGIFEHKKLDYELDPYNIHDKIEWKSSDEKVLVVDENGVVSTVGFGTATVTAKLFDTVKTTKFTVSYDSSTPATSANKKIEIGSTDKIDIKNYIPATVAADSSTFRWFSTNEQVLTVDENGTVTAVGLGNAEIIAGVVSGTLTANYYSCKYEVVCEIELEKSKEIEVFQSMYAKDVIKYISSEECIPTLKWTIDNPEIISIDGMGIITADKVGRTKIRTSISGKEYECEIIVNGSLNIEETRTNIIKGEEHNILDLFESGGNELLKQNLRFESLDPNIVQVKGNKMYGNNFGETKIRITSEYFDTSYEIDVSVTYEFIMSSNIDMMVGQSAELVSKKNPENLNVKWTSSNENIAIVDSNGKVTALNTGIVTIKANVNNEREFTSTVSISLPIKLEVQENVIINDKIPVNLIVPEGMTVSDFDSVEWKSSDESIATIDEKGMATGVKAGTAQISAIVKYKNFENTYTVDLTVEDIVLESIKIISTKDQIDLSDKDHTAKLSLEINPGDATGLGKAKWKSLNENVAIIDQEGTLIAIGQGSAIITAELNGVKADYVITVTQTIEDIDIEFNYEQVTVGNEYQAILKVNPEEATDFVIPEWSSSDESIFTVDENGLIKALKKGTAKLTAKIKGFEAEYEITVGGADVVIESEAPETPDKPEMPDKPDVTEKPTESNSDVSNSDIDKPKAEDKDKDTASEDTTSSDNENQKPVSDSDKESRGNTDEDTSSNDTPSDNTSSKSEKDNTSKDNEKPNTTVNTGESNTMSIIAYVTMILAGVSATIMTFFRRRLKREPQA